MPRFKIIVLASCWKVVSISTAHCEEYGKYTHSSEEPFNLSSATSFEEQICKMVTTLPKRPALQPQTVKKGPYTVPAHGALPVVGETLPRRHPSAQHKLLQHPEQGVETIYDILERSARKFGNADALGSRRVLDTHVETKSTPDGRGGTVEKKWTFSELSDYTYISFEELRKRALRVGAAMRMLGLQRGDRVEVYGATSAFWFTVAHGTLFSLRMGYNQAD
jgi:long-chain acyl-CoA synthetase